MMFNLRFPGRVPGVRQHDLTDCGAACLDSISRHYGLRIPISRIRQLAFTDRKGTNVLGMIHAAERLGFTAKGVKGSFASLERVPMPAIAHVIVGEVLHHFVVICAVTRRHVMVMDPADGLIHRLPHAEFQRTWTGILILLAPSEGFAPGHQGESTFRRFWGLARPHRTVLLQALVGAVVYTVLGLSTAVYVQKIVDHVIVDGNSNLLNLMSVVMLLLIAVQVYIACEKQTFMLRTGQKIDAALILGYYQHLLRLPQRFFDTMRVGEIVSRVNDAVKIRAFINGVSLELLVNLLVVSCAFALMFVYSWRLALIATAVVPAYALIFFAINRLNRRNQRQIMESSAELESQLVESLGAMGTIKRHGLEGFAELRTETRLVRVLRPVQRGGTSAIVAGGATELVSRLSTVVLLWTGTTFVLQQSLSPGELMSFHTLIGYLTGPITGLITANQAVQDAVIAADRLFEIMDLEREEAEGSIELTAEMMGDIKFEGVSFRYGAGAQVFRNLDLVLPGGRITAVIGESGSGKSTLGSLLQRLYSLESGRVLVGKYDLRDLGTESLRRRIGVVPQGVDLFAGTILENIAIGDFEPDMRRVVDICDRLGVTDFVRDLPYGFDSPLGEHGATLSGGQRQRLAIARALYREPSVLIMDEATSALDSVSEAFVQRTIQELRRQGCTIVLIAHRLSTVMGADKIVVLDGGRVVEEGSHHELMLREGSYYRLWRHQLLPDPAPAGFVHLAERIVQSQGAGASGGGSAGALPDWLRGIR